MISTKLEVLFHRLKIKKNNASISILQIFIRVQRRYAQKCVCYSNAHSSILLKN